MCKFQKHRKKKGDRLITMSNSRFFGNQGDVTPKQTIRAIYNLKLVQYLSLLTTMYKSQKDIMKNIPKGFM